MYDNPGYSFISHPRKSGKDGVGVSILNGTNWERREDLENEKVEAILLEFRSSHPNSFV